MFKHGPSALGALAALTFPLPVNLSQSRDAGFGVDPETSAKGRIVHLISSVQTLLRGKSAPRDVETLWRTTVADMGCCAVPLIVVNVLIIAYELVLG